jgi:AcrR family transcriptional regulator
LTSESLKSGLEGARRRRRKDARPAEILDAAMLEFAQKGYAGAKLTDVARRAGISHGLVYNYFDTKEALFRALFRARLVDSLDSARIPHSFSGQTTPSVLRTALLIAFRQLAGSDAVALIRIILVEGERFPDLVRECRAEVFGKAELMLRVLIEQGIANQELVEGPYRKHAIVLLAPIITAVLFGPLSGARDWVAQSEAEIEAFIDAVLGGIAIP